MRKSTVPRGTSRRPDPEGEAWQAEADRRWAAAELAAAAAGDAAFTFYVPLPLPAWSAPAHVRRELLGRYLHDRDANLVHDVAHALETCAIDAIRNATFVHFAHELDAVLPADVVDCACMRA